MCFGAFVLTVVATACAADDASEDVDTDTETGASSGADTDIGLPEEVRAAAAEHTEIYCAETLECRCPGVSPFADLESCRANQIPNREEHFGRAVAAGLTFDEACFQAAVAEYQSLGTCDGSIQDYFTGECYDCPFFHGEQDVGEPCERGGSWSSCRPGLACGSAREDDPGICIDVCNPGGPGARCFSFRECGEGLLCLHEESEGGSGLGRCIAPAGLGQPCGGACQEGLDCGSDGLCAPLGSVGESCDLPQDCAEGLTCGDERTCTPRSLEGEPCDEVPCLLSLVCDREDPDQPMCQERREIGQPCSTDGNCIDGICEDGACQDPETWCREYE